MFANRYLIENNVWVAELCVSTYLSRWMDSRSEIGSIQKRGPYRSSIHIAELKDSSLILLFSVLMTAPPPPLLAYRAIVCGRVPWLYQYWPGGFTIFVVLCPGTPEGSTGSGSGFKASQKTGQRLKVSSDRLGEAGNRTCDPWFTRQRFIPYTMAASSPKHPVLCTQVGFTTFYISPGY